MSFESSELLVEIALRWKDDFCLGCLVIFSPLAGVALLIDLVWVVAAAAVALEAARSLRRGFRKEWVAHGMVWRWREIPLICGVGLPFVVSLNWLLTRPMAANDPVVSMPLEGMRDIHPFVKLLVVGLAFWWSVLSLTAALAAFYVWPMRLLVAVRDGLADVFTGAFPQEELVGLPVRMQLSSNSERIGDGRNESNPSRQGSENIGVRRKIRWKDEEGGAVAEFSYIESNSCQFGDHERGEEDD